MDIKKIIEAWSISRNPTNDQTEMAERRLKICDNCDSKREYMKKIKMLVLCSECGCPLAKKSYTNSYNACPLGKWKETDLPFFPDQKTKKTIL